MAKPLHLTLREKEIVGHLARGARNKGAGGGALGPAGPPIQRSLTADPCGSSAH